MHNYYQNREGKKQINKCGITQERLEYIIFDNLKFEKNGKYNFLELGSGIYNIFFTKGILIKIHDFFFHGYEGLEKRNNFIYYIKIGKTS